MREPIYGEKHTKLLDSSFMFLANHGLENASIHNLCDATGIAVSSIYYWFQDKEDMISLNVMGDEFVVVADDPEVFRGMIKLNKSGAFVFELIQAETSKKDIIDKIVKKYDIDEKTASGDLIEYIETFKAAGLIENE